VNTIYKYPITPTDEPAWPTELALPEGARALSVGVQRDVLMLWAMVDPDAPPAARAIRVFATGQELEYAATGMQFVGTAVQDGLFGPLVWHVFVEPA
jgi:hypothetical protein